MTPRLDQAHRFNIGDHFAPHLIVEGGSFATLDEADSNTVGSLVYCQNLHYLQKAAQNPNVCAVICPPALINELTGTGKAIIAAESPRHAFFELYLRLKASGDILPQMSYGVGEGCSIHPSAVVSPKARLGNRVVIGAHSVIEDYCELGDDVEVGANVVIGAEGLLTLRQTDGRLLRVSHAGGVTISEGCQILSGAVIAKSLYRGFTFIGPHSQIGIMTNIGHGAYVGEACVISGNSVIAGRTRLEDRVWVGTSASVAQGLVVGQGAQIKMGAVVVADVPAGAVMSGNFAVNHRVNMARYLKGTA